MWTSMDISMIIEKFFDLFAFVFHVLTIYVESLYRVFVPPPMRSITGEIILVTGSARGLGKEICKLLAQYKVTLIMWDINKTENENTAKEIQALYPTARIFPCCVDISKRENIERAAIKIKAEIGDVSVVINNAGIAPIQPFLKTDPYLVQKTFDINVLSHLWILREFLPRMIENHHGHIATVVSMGAVRQSGGCVPYFSTKCAAHGYLESLKLQLAELNAHGIKFTTLYPYYVNTQMLDQVSYTNKIKIPIFKSVFKLLDPKDVAVKFIEGIRRGYEYIYYPKLLYYLMNADVLLPLKLRKELAIYWDSQLEHPEFPLKRSTPYKT